MLKWAVSIVVIAAAGAYWYGTRIPSTPFDGAKVVSSPEQIKRGAYVAILSDCVACHTAEKGIPMAGGLPMGLPFGHIFTPNITPDKETGIGNYSLAQFDNAVRRGVAADGRRLYPAMPYPSYAKLTDDDIKAMYDYFMNELKPVKQARRPSDFDWPLTIRWPLEYWNLAFYRSGTYQPDPNKDAMWNRGAYLVQGAGHCGACHTPRGIAIQERGLDQSSKHFVAGAPLDGWFAPSLRNDHNVGLGRWSEAEVVEYLKTGRNRHGVVFGSMTDAFNNSTQYMTDDDLTAIAHYLKSMPGNPERDGKPWTYVASTATAASDSPAKPGEQVYLARCAFCHGRDGRGRDIWISPLAGASSLLAKENASAINITLNGSPRVAAGGEADTYRMPPLRTVLNDQEIADVLSYVRSTWGNNAGAVTVDEVKSLRQKTNSASSDVIILRMR